jgi:Sulfotransferase family
MIQTAAQASQYPDFYIVGAPRCGTTFMYEYLRQHPQIFMPDNKEPNFMCKDLDSGSYLDSLSFMRDEAAYIRLFAGAPAGSLRGEASTWYLYSETAAGLIKAMNPDSRVIIMLRDPVEMLYSLHGRRVYGGSEGLPFVDAFEGE